MKWNLCAMKWNREDVMATIWLLIMIGAFVGLIMYLIAPLKGSDKFTQRNPGYDKELALFRSLGDADRATYLEMNVSDKLYRYGNHLK